MSASIRVDTSQARQMIDELQNRMGDITEMREGIGILLVASTQQRFIDEAAPNGDPWLPLSPVTLKRRRLGGAGAKILRDTSRMASGIQYRVSQGETAIYSPEIYAGTHQYGARKGQYGKTRRGTPIPWGDVPQRAFLGVNATDQADIEELLQRYIDASQPRSWWRSLLDKIRRLF